MNVALIDFSPSTSNLISFAHQWSVHTSQPLQLMHSVDSPEFAMAGSNKEEWKKEEQESAITLLEKRSLDLIGETLPSHANTTNLCDGVLELHKNQPINLLFMGLKGSGFWKRIMIGSKVIEVSESVDLPVFAVPRHCRFAGSYTVFVSVSPQHSLNMPALEQFIANGRGIIEKMVFISVATSKDDLFEVEENLLGLVKLSPGHLPASSLVIKGGSAFETLKKQLADKNDVLLLVQKGSRAWNELLFRKFLVNELVYDGALPLLILPST